jgi:nucleoid DNA-binding protein
MVKADLVYKVLDKTKLTKRQTNLLINSFMYKITDALSKGEKVEIRGFGSFKIRNINSRKWKCPISGENLNIPAKKYPHFKAAKELKKLVDKN